MHVQEIPATVDAGAAREQVSMADATTPEPDAAEPVEPADEPLLVHGCPAVESLGQTRRPPDRERSTSTS